jgi:hypothetical protein
MKRRIVNVFINLAIIVGFLLAGSLMNLLLSSLFIMEYVDMQQSPIWFLYAALYMFFLVYVWDAQ